MHFMPYMIEYNAKPKLSFIEDTLSISSLKVRVLTISFSIYCVSDEVYNRTLCTRRGLDIYDHSTLNQ